MSRDLAVEVKTQEVPFVGSDERRDHRDAETEAQDGGARASAGGRRRCPGSGEGDPKECTEQQDAGGHFLHQQEARHRHAACRGDDPEVFPSCLVRNSQSILGSAAVLPLGLRTTEAPVTGSDIRARGAGSER